VLRLFSSVAGPGRGLGVKGSPPPAGSPEAARFSGRRTSHCFSLELPRPPALLLELFQEMFDLLLIELPEFESILHYQSHLPGVELVGVSVPEEVPEGP